MTFIGNSPRETFTVYGDSECIVDSSVVDIFINSSIFRSQNARSLNVSGSNISLHINNSSFVNHVIAGNGGVIALRGNDFCKLYVSNSSFVNTTASQGGAINTECAKVYSVSFQGSNFTANTATTGGGGAVYIDSLGSASSDLEYSTHEQADLNYKGQRSEQLHQININKCDFTNAKSFTRGGAVYIKAPNASILLSHSAFTDCVTFTVVVRQEGGGGGGGVFIDSG